MGPDQRRWALDDVVAREVAGGWRVVDRSDFHVVLTTGTPVNHVLHLLLTVVTCGLWGVVWLFAAIAGGTSTKALFVDEDGVVRAGVSR